ncbi:STAS domain-containing protein [Peribacillus glennii]|uniref:STAS domain-containing protein n=1 Tax=Peribacillus glennii TaxID=2303991 RepID=A0A372LFH0_9BACI|nr:STAS domain-containing protein [Peribacillus glennii]RFU65030.1 STAS domain-containing protein [Peribacillus glennii]
MHRNKALYEFLLDRTLELTEQWYNSLDKSDETGVYVSTDPKVIKGVKNQNHEFHKRFCKVFVEEESQFFETFEEWILDIAQDPEHLRTPVHLILREFFRTQQQYLALVKEFVSLQEGKFTKEQMDSWNQIIIKTFSEVMTWFTREHDTYSQKQLQAQQEMILALSSPIISLTRNTALLPLIGDIDTARAKFLLENTLQQCSAKGVNHLFIDLSGVVMIDTLVAHQLFQMIEGLNLLGVQSTLSGLRPDIAQTAVQLGLPFDKVSITSTLEKAINQLFNV